MFESCAEGMISVVRQTSPDHYQLVETIPTQLWAKTMAFDARTKKIFLPMAELETVPSFDPAKPLQRRVKPGSFAVLVVER